jgi:Flp pilus assembly protein TadB
MEMNRNEAAAALADVNRTEQKLAERAHWPFHRHAMFGLSEGLLVAAIAQPIGIAGGMTAAALALVVVCVMEDRRRHGLFVSGWQAGATRPLTWLLVLFMLAMVVAAALARDGQYAQPIGYALGLFTFAVTIAISFRWEKVYRAQLASGGAR